MKQSLQVRLSQHLALTPQLQQSIRLLQLSTLELHQEVEQMLEQNPFLEPEGDDGTPWDPPAERATSADRVTERERDAAGEGEREVGGGDGAEALPEVSAGEFGTSERDDWENGTERDDFDGIRELPSAAGSGSGGDDDEGEAHDRRAAGGTLADHLRAQLSGLRLCDEDAAALLMLIDSLDEDGYLTDPLEEIALAAGAAELDEEDQEDLMSRLRCARHWLQRLDPPGVGACNLAECLTIQLRQRPTSEARRVALRIAQEQLEALARRDVKRLCAALGCDEQLLREAQALIVACEPKPGRPFVNAEANIIVPDVIVQRAGRSMKVSLNPDVMPRLRINDLYAAALKAQRGSHLSSHLQEARWFMKNIQQRFDTILRVSKAIVERQKAFFTHGEIAMKPLVLREIADELGLHESTISRVTTAKYMATPQGTFELKYFFGSSLNTEAGGNASSTAVRALIKQLVSAEDPAKPLSDSAISDMLEEQGIQVARRTVAKYREALKIAPANLRKAL
ncbi:MAG: RNA polymerase factor sigma-54 [Rubrivivax sp.]|nr:RNA polymerase factor sigma-54 [Rubrivivax sp.]